VRVSDAGGLSAAASVTVTVLLGSRPGDPRIDALTLSPASFLAARSGPSVAARGRRAGTSVSFALSEAAGVRFTVERARAGRRIGGRCVPKTRRDRRRGRACTLYRKLGGFLARSGGAGANGFRFRGRLAGRALAPSRYRLVAVAATPDGRRSLPVLTGFWVIRR